MIQQTLKSILIAASIILSANATAGNNQFSVETDPATLAFNGYAAHIRMAPKQWENWSLGLGVYALDIPNFMLTADNKDKGWNSRLQRGIGLFAEYYLNQSRQGWFFGAQLAKQDYALSKDSNNSETVYSNQLLMLHSGYRWYPASTNAWYVQPWLGLGYTRTSAGHASLAGEQFHISHFIPFATVHLGYEF